jgi:valyl-tRNA synthetase
MHELPKTYDPKAVEATWYRYWRERGYFGAPVEPGRPRFSITIPPPNVTGELHMGHALQHAVHDLIVRRKRMQGFNTLCLPGTDHASIGTSVKIEQALRQEGKSRWDLGREAYLERAWEWTRKYGGTILEQLQALGCSYDWSRTRFTLDDGYYRAVTTAFVRCYERGWIYRGKRVMNWCATCQTVVSDLEVKHQDVAANLWQIRYPRVDGSGFVTVATTRPETMLGDTAVAVRPGDPRYAAQVGQLFRLPLVGRQIPMVADHHVDAAFGTGVVKVTPAHDPNDFEIGQRHGLPAVEVIGPDGRMTAAAGAYAGMTTAEARAAVLQDLDREGLLEKVEPYTHAVGHHDRCGKLLDPLLSEQWFMRMEPLAAKALAAIRGGRVRFTPERFQPMAEEWLANVRDWCISRQLWWGQRIPVYTCAACKVELAAVEPPAACPQCGGAVAQDPDVLDTWFSSALWPFATLGWPDETPELGYFYPTDLMITGRDILYLWIARMVMMGEEFMEAEPFRDVVIHATVMDAEGKRMSKSLGTGVDPLELVHTYGADATRFALTSMVGENQDIRFKIEQYESVRNFCNKLWNISRFTLLYLGDDPPPLRPLAELKGERLELADRWILSRFAATAAAVNEALDRYALGEASWLLYHFAWHDLADWYVELIKPRLQGRAGQDAVDARGPLLAVLEATLRLAHPFLPFLTEAVWQALPGTGDSIMIAPYPGFEAGRDGRVLEAIIQTAAGTVAAFPDDHALAAEMKAVTQDARHQLGPGPDELRDEAAERSMARVIEVARAIRALRAELQVKPVETMQVAAAGEPLAPEEQAYVELAASARFGDLPGDLPHVRTTAGGLEIRMALPNMLDLRAETERIRKQRAQLERELAGVRGRLANPQFLERAPAEQVEKARQQEADLLERLQVLQERLALFGG